MADLLCIGDVTVDLFLEIHEASVNCELDPHECKLVLDYADKIPVTRLTKVVGAGNAANVAVGASRLGVDTALYTLVGDDSEGREARQVFRDEEIESDFVVTDSGRRSNLSAIINFRGERTILTYHEERKYELPELVKTDWVYLTSMGKGFEEVYGQIVKHTTNRGRRLVFQPGSMQMRADREWLKGLVKRVEVMVVNKKEAEELLGSNSGEIRELLLMLREWGVKIVVITDGERGSWADDGIKVRFVAAVKTPMVERTGAGDAYAAGLVSGLIKGEELGEAMRWGTVNAAAVVGKIGSRAGLLRIEELEGNLGECPGAEER